MVAQFDVYLVTLDPTLGGEMKKTRPCVIISPNEMNRPLNTVIIAPMTSTVRGYPTRSTLSFQGKKGEIALDQMRAIDKKRLIKKMGAIHPSASKKALSILQEMFSS